MQINYPEFKICPKKMFYYDVISKKRYNSKELWNFIKSVISSKHLPPQQNILDINGTSVEDLT